MPSYLEGASMSPREGGAMNRGEPPQRRYSVQRAVVARSHPGRGDFSFRDFSHAPSDKNLSKNDSAHKGGSLCVKDAFAKNFLVPGEILLAALAFRTASLQNNSGLPQGPAARCFRGSFRVR